VVIVTGGSKGIGEAIVRSFADEDAVTVIVNRPGEEGPKLEADLRLKGRRSIFLPAELNEESECIKVIDGTINNYRKIDIIVNNAGHNDSCGIDRSPSEFMQSVHSNLFHYYTMVHYGLKYLIETKGNIINIGSHVSVNGQGNTSGYAAAKGAINSLTREWAVDFIKYGIRVNCVVPGGVWTNAFKRWADRITDPEERKKAVKDLADKVPFGKRFTTSREIADTVVFLSSACSSHTTGEIIFPDGGYTHLDRACT
jgi:L-fucose dehydrogenase